MTIQLQLRPSHQRGHADHGWLDTRHSFSFAHYYDPRHLGFGQLRVINQDVVAPGRGFGAHAHRSMEIVSYVLRGALEHRDSIGTGSVIRPGEVQLMSAGRGITHSEFNASATEPVEFLQIWIQPSRQGGQPGYQQAAFDAGAPGLRLVVSPDGREGSLTIQQDADLYRLLLPAGATTSLAPRHDRVWVQLISGQLLVHGQPLGPGDGLALLGARSIELAAEGRMPNENNVHAIIFDLP